ncbi:MAG: DUF4286 family protein [Flavobacteriaceae bacterium]|jgi:hypothetical protein|nr:DUF4286 family protein [Flavobacteriaceae bacterium]
MIIYSESFHVEHSVEEEWVLWMKKNIIPDMLSQGRFSRAVFAKVISHSDETGNTYSVQYYIKDKAELEDFYKKHSGKITQSIFTKFGTQVLSFKTELELIETFDL